MAESKGIAINEKRKEIVDVVANKIKTLQTRGEIHFPPNYSPDNALKSAWLIIQQTEDMNKQPALAVCTKESIINAMFDMTIQGLSPAKKQCYFIVNAKKLTLMRSYFGTCAVLKRLSHVDDVVGQVVYKGDEFEYEIDLKARKHITKHVQKLENVVAKIDNIVCVYAITFLKNGDSYAEIMTNAQIRQSWTKSRMKDPTVQKEYPDQMALRTVYNRAGKIDINTSDDSDLLIEAINRTTDNEFIEDADPDDIADNNANVEVLDFKSEVSGSIVDEDGVLIEDPDDKEPSVFDKSDLASGVK